MGSSRGEAYLIRAAAHGLLNTEHGCPPTLHYLLRESFIIRELEREETLRLGIAKVNLCINSAQIYTQSVYDIVHTKLFETAYDKALLIYNRLGYLMQPWDKKWDERIKEVERSIYDKQNTLGDTGITDRGLVAMIADYERIKREREQESKHESDRPAND